MGNYELWLVKAHNDLDSSRKLIKGENPIFDTALYHTQQCAEKALKGYLAFCEIPIQKTHDLRLIIDICVKFDKEFLE